MTRNVHLILDDYDLPRRCPYLSSCREDVYVHGNQEEVKNHNGRKTTTAKKERTINCLDSNWKSGPIFHSHGNFNINMLLSEHFHHRHQHHNQNIGVFCFSVNPLSLALKDTQTHGTLIGKE